MDFEIKKYLLDTTIKLIKEGNGQGISKSYNPENIAEIYNGLVQVLDLDNDELFTYIKNMDA